MDDDRGNLTLAFAKLALRMREINGLRFVIWENVRGVLSDETNGFGCLLAALAGADGGVDALVSPGGGWPNSGHVLAGATDDVDDVTVAWRVLNSQYFDVPQRRERVFLVASFDPAVDTGSVLFEYDGQKWNPSTRREPKEEAAGSGQGGTGELIWPPVLGTLNASGAGMSRPAGLGNELDFVIILSDGTVRRPTPLECERAQGFPDHWTDIEIGGRRALYIDRYRGIGNSMSVTVMEFIGHRLQAAADAAHRERIAA